MDGRYYELVEETVEALRVSGCGWKPGKEGQGPWRVYLGPVVGSTRGDRLDGGGLRVSVAVWGVFLGHRSKGYALLRTSLVLYLRGGITSWLRRRLRL